MSKYYDVSKIPDTITIPSRLEQFINLIKTSVE